MSGAWPEIGYAIVLLGAGLVLIWLEVLVVSFGLLGAAAVACMAGAIYFAFQVGPFAGWLFALLVPVLSVACILLGVRRIGRSRLVMRSEVGADAGYRHAAERIGIEVGAVGEMITPAFPSGRARFDRGECDVRAHSGTLARGDEVQVLAVDGATVTVAARRDPAHTD